MKAIETEYKGYKFRSRLEARWAVFFDEARIPYEYEPEGYELPIGLYLPDFYLPWFRLYVEIKPNEDSAIDKGDKCCRILRDNLEESITALCIGDPADSRMRLYCYTHDDSGIKSYEYDKSFFVEGASWKYWQKGSVDFDCSSTKHWIDIMVDEPEMDRGICTRNGKWCCVESIWTSGDYYGNHNEAYLITDCRSVFTYSKYIARKARFEHGENPIPHKYEDLPDNLPFANDFWNFVKASKFPKNNITYHRVTDGQYDIEEAGLEDIWG